MKVSLTRLLNEIKLLDQRITKASTTSVFVQGSVGGKPPQGYSSVEEVSKQVLSDFQSVKDLIKQRNDYKSKLVLANASTELTVAGEKMTIAQAIERKRTIDLEKQLLRTLTQQFANIKNQVDKHNQQMEQTIDQMLTNLHGKDRKVGEDEVKAVSDPYRKQHQATLIDPLNIRVKITELEKFISTFENEVDFVLSETNARTEVEI